MRSTESLLYDCCALNVHFPVFFLEMSGLKLLVMGAETFVFPGEDSLLSTPTARWRLTAWE